jgi:hypothetical protein
MQEVSDRHFLSKPLFGNQLQQLLFFIVDFQLDGRGQASKPVSRDHFRSMWMVVYF